MALDFEVLFRCVIAVDILLCAAIIVTNLVLFFTIVTSRSARASTRNAMLASVCVADLMVGMFTHPVYIHSYHTETMFHSCEMHIAIQLIGDYCQDFVCFWTLVTLGSLYFRRLARHRWGWGAALPETYGPLNDPPPSKWRTVVKVAKKALLVGWPWLGTALIPIPVLLTNWRHDNRDMLWDETFCPLHIEFPSQMAVTIIVFYMPVAALILICLLIGWVMYCDMSQARSLREARQREEREREREKNPHFLHHHGDREVNGARGGGRGRGSDPLMTRDGFEEGGRGRFQDPFPASRTNRPQRDGGVRSGRHGGTTPGSPIYTGRSAGGGGGGGRVGGGGEGGVREGGVRGGGGVGTSSPPPPPPQLPTLSSLRTEPENRKPETNSHHHAWASAAAVADNDNDDNDPTHVMMGPVGEGEDGDLGRRDAADENGTRTRPAQRERVIHTRGVDPSVILVRGGGRRVPETANGDLGFSFGADEDEEAGLRVLHTGGARGEWGERGESGRLGEEGALERPGHIMIPLLSVVACALPLLVVWWFYGLMPYDTVIIVSVILSRMYLLRAAVLPAAWFTLPELRLHACLLWSRIMSCGGQVGDGVLPQGGGASGDMGAYSVAYTTLRETNEGQASGDVMGEEVGRERRDSRRQNPFDTNVRA